MTQRAIFDPPGPLGRFLTWSLAPDATVEALRRALEGLVLLDGEVVGLGLPLTRLLKREVPGLREAPSWSGPGVACPATQGALWMALGGRDAGSLLHRARDLVRRFDGLLVLDEDVGSFTYGNGRDLSGYEDGTENPKGERMAEVALAPDGSSFVAVQRWVHDLQRFDALAPNEQDHAIGRSRDTNEELPHAPRSAHVQRAAQESFEPGAFMLRRSMPWGDAREHGLYFVAYGATLDPFERVLHRMMGRDDGIVDGLFRFTRPGASGCYWCPPAIDGRLVLGL